jgi:hypothetical protein
VKKGKFLYNAMWRRFAGHYHARCCDRVRE